MTHVLTAGGVHEILAVLSPQITQAENSYQHTEAIGLHFLIRPRQTPQTAVTALAALQGEEPGLQHPRLCFAVTQLRFVKFENRRS